MERTPNIEPELPLSPQEKGEIEGAKKKKKKTTRIPLPIIKTEAQESKKPPSSTEKTTAPLDQLVKSPETAQTDTLFFPEETLLSANEQIGKLSVDDVNPTETTLDDETDHSQSQTVDLIFSRQAPITPTQEIVTQSQETTDTLRPLLTGISKDEEPLYASERLVEAVDHASIPASVAEGADWGVAAAGQLADQVVGGGSVSPEQQAATNLAAEYSNPASNVASKEEVSDAYYRGEKRGVRRGVLVGGLFGWWLGRRGKKAVEHEAKAAIAAKDSEIKALKNQQTVINERLASIEKTKVHMASIEQKATIKSTKTEQITLSPERPGLQEAPKVQAKERLKKNQEKDTAVTAEAEDNNERKVKQENRIETSSWHSFEVDKHTGKLATEQSVRYGEAFRQERAQELKKYHPKEPKIVGSVGSTSLAGVASTVSLQPTTNTPPHTVKSSVFSTFKDKKFIREQVVKRTSDPLTWVIAAVITVLLIVIGIV
jgi:hypothetical protein